MAGALAATGAALAGAFWLGIYRPGGETMIALGVASVLGGLFPDVDTASKGRRLFYGAALVADAVLLFKEQFRYAAVLGFCALLPAVGSHRGWTHTWWAALLIPCPVLLVPVILFHVPWPAVLPYYLAMILGYISHLVMDGKL